MKTSVIHGLYLGHAKGVTKAGRPITFVNLIAGPRPLKIGIMSDVEINAEDQLGRQVKVTLAHPSGTLWTDAESFSIELDK